MQYVSLDLVEIDLIYNNILLNSFLLLFVEKNVNVTYHEIFENLLRTCRRNSMTEKYSHEDYQFHCKTLLAANKIQREQEIIVRDGNPCAQTCVVIIHND
jgi:hypothetical protein